MKDPLHLFLITVLTLGIAICIFMVAICLPIYVTVLKMVIK